MANELEKMIGPAQNMTAELSLTTTVLTQLGKTISTFMGQQQALGRTFVALQSITDTAADSLQVLDDHAQKLGLTLENLNSQLLGLYNNAQLPAPDAKAGKMLSASTSNYLFPTTLKVIGTGLGLAVEEERKKNPQSDTPQKFDQFQQNFDKLGATIGTALLPALSSVLTVINPIVAGINAWMEKNRELANGLILVATAAISANIIRKAVFGKKSSGCCCSQKRNNPEDKGQDQGWMSKIGGKIRESTKNRWKKWRGATSNTVEPTPEGTEESGLGNIGNALAKTKNKKVYPAHRTWSGSRKNPRKTRRKNQGTPDTSHTPPNQGEIGDTTQKVRARSRNNPAIKSIAKSQTPPMMGFAGSSNQYFQQTANDANKLGLILNGPLTNSISRSNNVFSVLGATMRRIPLFMVFDAIQQLWPAIEGMGEVIKLCWNGSWDEAISKLAEIGGMIIDFMDGTILGTVYTGFAKLWNFFGGSLPETLGEATKPWLESKIIKGAPDQNSDAETTNEPASAIGSTISESTRNDAPTKPSITEISDSTPQPQRPPAQHSAGRQTEGSSGGVVVNFSPTIHIQGTLLDKIQQEVMQALRLKEPELEQTMNRIFAQQSRRSYA